MKNSRQFAIAGLLILVVLFVLPFLIPTKSYIPKLEQLVAEKVGVPVHIGAMSIAFLPTPRLNLEEVTVGDHQEVFVKKISAIPALTSLFSDTKVISTISIKGPVVKKAAMQILAGLADKAGSEPSSMAVAMREIEVSDAELVWLDDIGQAGQGETAKSERLKMPLFNATITLAEGNKPQSALIETADGKLKISLVPDEQPVKGRVGLVTVHADHWVVPVGYLFLIDKLNMEMTLHEDRLDITRLEADLYHGKVTGSGKVNWASAWNAQGKLKVDDLSVREPLSLVSKSTQLSGLLYGAGGFNATAKEPGKLLEQLRANFRFKVQDGVLYGLDLVRAATLLLRQGQKGGETRFDELSGLLNVSGSHYRVSELIVSSGLIAADGEVKMNAQKELDGVVNVELKNSVSLTAIPMQVSGTMDKPVIFPTKAALAGAVAGTALLGPGVGTSLGVKAGSAVDKLKGLFGGDEK